MLAVHVLNEEINIKVKHGQLLQEIIRTESSITACFNALTDQELRKATDEIESIQDALRKDLPLQRDCDIEVISFPNENSCIVIDDGNAFLNDTVDKNIVMHELNNASRDVLAEESNACCVKNSDKENALKVPCDLANSNAIKSTGQLPNFDMYFAIATNNPCLINTRINTLKLNATPDGEDNDTKNY
ncbi:hypothetical protein AVEN_64564-1 [Araneus ventricosus]|uniref:Uncharacterized protein n=1 Tax=Araneus ventricosus TaxID=182803 RepID=A0A4Y2RZH1_ARAVE|nr:hypothetical protein AVEN_64564-1 [Araneus ventricosus]